MGFGGGALRKPGVVSSHKQMIENDKTFLKTILQRKNDKTSRHKLANDIRDHFWGLTRDFMIPFERYFARLMPLKSAMSPFKQIPQMPTFDPKDFLKTLPLLEATQTTKCRNWTASKLVCTVVFQHPASPDQKKNQNPKTKNRENKTFLLLRVTSVR